VEDKLLFAFPATATAVELILLELTLSQPVILAQLSNELKRMVVAVCYANYYDPISSNNNSLFVDSKKALSLLLSQYALF
jgi:hypothetical protein